MNPDENKYEMVMPFVVVTSAGGPFADDAFVAGAEFGAIDERLRVARAMSLEVPPRAFDSRLIPQLDLLAMKHGYAIRAEETESDEWQIVTFVQPTSGDDG